VIGSTVIKVSTTSEDRGIIEDHLKKILDDLRVRSQRIIEKRVVREFSHKKPALTGEFSLWSVSHGQDPNWSPLETRD